MNSPILKRYFVVYSIITALLVIIVPAWGRWVILRQRDKRRRKRRDFPAEVKKTKAA